MEYSHDELADARNFLEYLTNKYPGVKIPEPLYQMLFIAINGLRGSSVNGKYIYELYKDYRYYCCIYQKWKSTFSTLSNPELGRKKVSLTVGNLKFPISLTSLEESKLVLEKIDGLKIFESVSFL